MRNPQGSLDHTLRITGLEVSFSSCLLPPSEKMTVIALVFVFKAEREFSIRLSHRTFLLSRFPLHLKNRNWVINHSDPSLTKESKEIKTDLELGQPWG